MTNESRDSGEISVATGFSRWNIFAHWTSAVGTTDVCRAYGTVVLQFLYHRLKPVAIEISPLSRLSVVHYSNRPYQVGV
jgi:hypothetical protein